MRVPAALTAAIGVAAVAALLLVPARNTARAALSGSPSGAETPSATFSVGPAGVHAINESFAVAVNLSDVAFTVGVPNWSGYQLELHYDPSILIAIDVSPGLCPRQDWVRQNLTPTVGTGCLFQQSTVTTGPIETITFTCIAAGTSALHMPPSLGVNLLFGPAFDQPVDFAMTLTDGSVTCDDTLATATFIPTPSATNTPSSSPTATATLAGAPDSAAIAVSAPVDAQPLNVPFLITTNLAAFVPGSSPYWAGYDVELAYDPTILQVDYAAPVLCPRTHWGNPFKTPHVVTGCFGLQSTATGILENMVVQCLRDGVTPIHAIPEGDSSALWNGTDLFDEYTTRFALTLREATVTCAQQVDDDGDGCRNAEEGALGLNPFNPWDFYNVPVPSLFAAVDPRLVLKDNAGSAGDAQAVFAYFGAGARMGTPTYDADLDGNGVRDGLQYDRRFVGPGESGPPDGVVTVRDAQLAFAQFTRGFKC